MLHRILETTVRTLLCTLLLLSTFAPALAPGPSLAGSALAQDGAREEARDETFEDVSDVIEVQIPVNVSNRAGAPIRGLTADDFEVFDRGSRQELSGFDVVDLEVLQANSMMGPTAVEAAIPAAARRHFLLLFDLTFATPASVTKARNAARDFVLRELHPTDLAAAATYSLDVGPRLLVTFTPDRAQLARAIDTLGAPRLLAQEGSIDPLRFMIEDPHRSGMSSTFAETETEGGVGAGISELVDQEVQAYLRVISNQMDRMERSYARGRVSSWVAGLDEMAQIMASVEGRKHVVFFSEGFDGRLMLGRGADASDREAQSDRLNLSFGQHWMVDTDDIYGNTALQGQMGDALETFRRADCVIQAVDISGLGSDSSEDRRARSVGQDALFYMANETGGALFEDTNDLGAELNEVLERSIVTYLLSFQPKGLEYDGSYHRIEVRLKGDRPRGTGVSHRAGYFAPRPFEDLHPLEKSLLASDAIASAAPRRDLDVDVLVAPFRAGAESAYVPVIIEVGGRKLISGQEKGSLSAEFYAYVSDDQGQMRDFFSQLVSLDLSEEGRENMSQAGLKYYGHLNLTPGDYLVRVLVRNASTGRTGVQSIRVSVPDYTADSPQLLPPFFIEPSNRWFLVREQRPTQQDSVVYPFTVNGSPYIPSARPVIEQGEASELVLVAYNLEDGDINLRGTVVGPDGDERSAEGLELVERTVTGIGGLDKLLARFQVGDLASGSYTLQVAVEQPGAGTTQHNSIPFSVRR
jgi:VWFA-related protein